MALCIPTIMYSRVETNLHHLSFAEARKANPWAPEFKWPPNSNFMIIRIHVDYWNIPINRKIM